jgi:hypothetical protein
VSLYYEKCESMVPLNGLKAFCWVVSWLFLVLYIVCVGVHQVASMHVSNVRERTYTYTHTYTRTHPHTLNSETVRDAQTSGVKTEKGMRKADFCAL